MDIGPTSQFGTTEQDHQNFKTPHVVVPVVSWGLCRDCFVLRVVYLHNPIFNSTSLVLIFRSLPSEFLNLNLYWWNYFLETQLCSCPSPILYTLTHVLWLPIILPPFFTQGIIFWSRKSSKHKKHWVNQITSRNKCFKNVEIPNKNRKNRSLLVIKHYKLVGSQTTNFYFVKPQIEGAFKGTFKQ